MKHNILDTIFMENENLTRPKLYQTANLENLKKALKIKDNEIISYLSSLHCYDENKIIRINENKIPLKKDEIKQVKTFLEDKIMITVFDKNYQSIQMFIETNLKKCLFGNNNTKNIHKPCLQAKVFGCFQFYEILGENFQSPYFLLPN